MAPPGAPNLGSDMESIQGLRISASLNLKQGLEPRPLDLLCIKGITVVHVSATLSYTARYERTNVPLVHYRFRRAFCTTGQPLFFHGRPYTPILRYLLSLTTDCAPCNSHFPAGKK